MTTSKEMVPCLRCAGTGRVQYRHVTRGNICFKCNGVGAVQMSPDKAEKFKKENAAFLKAVEDRYERRVFYVIRDTPTLRYEGIVAYLRGELEYVSPTYDYAEEFPELATIDEYSAAGFTVKGIS